MSKSLASELNAPAVERGAFKLSAAAQYLGGISILSVRRLIDRGQLKPCRGLRHVLIPKAELDRFLTQ